MRLQKIQVHILSNEVAIKQFAKNAITSNSFTPMSKDIDKRISRMENKAAGYLMRFGDKSMLTKTMKQDRQELDHMLLLLKLGAAIDKKETIEKAINITGKKDKNEDLQLYKLKDITDFEVKETVRNIEHYYTNKRLIDPNNKNMNVEQHFNTKSTIANTPLLGKSIDKLKYNMGFLAKLQSIPTNRLINKTNDSLEEDFDSDLENTELYTNYLNEERIEQEIETSARRNFQLKEVASKENIRSLDGDIPRAVITDLSFNAINNIIESISQRFNNQSVNNVIKPHKPHVRSNAMSPNQSDNLPGKIPSILSKPMPSIPTPFSLKMSKPSPEKINHIKSKSIKQLELSKIAQQKTLQISRKFMFAQENHMNYIDTEIFVRDQLEGREHLYDTGSRNPLSGRLFSTKIKTLHSDLRMDSQFKVRR